MALVDNDELILGRTSGLLASKVYKTDFAMSNYFMKAQPKQTSKYNPKTTKLTAHLSLHYMEQND